MKVPWEFSKEPAPGETNLLRFLLVLAGIYRLMFRAVADGRERRLERPLVSHPCANRLTGCRFTVDRGR